MSFQRKSEIQNRTSAEPFHRRNRENRFGRRANHSTTGR